MTTLARVNGAGASLGRKLETLARERLGKLRRPVTALGFALLVLGCLLPWADFPGFPGKMTLALWYAFPGGVRLYALVLAVAAVLAFVDLPGRRGALLYASLGALALVGYTLHRIADEGGGLVNVSAGGWLAVLGALLLALAALSLPPDRPLRGPRPLPTLVEIVLIVAAFALLLYLIVIGLDIDANSQFIGYGLLLLTAALALNKLGMFAWTSSISQRHRVVVILAGLAAATYFPFTQDGSSYYLRVAASIGVFAAAALGLNVVVGLAGLLDLGYVAFFGVGAYTGALLSGATLSAVDVHLPFALVIVLGAVIAAIFGVVIGAPTLRLRGDYLAIVTLGFGEIFRITVNNLDGSSGPQLTNGPNGIGGVPDIKIFGLDFGETHTVFGTMLPGFTNYYYLEIVLLILVVGAFLRLNTSRVGRAWVAIREDEVAAAAMGVNTTRLKLLAFAIGAFFAGAAGTVNTHVTRSAAPDSYTFLESVLLLAAVVFGGMGTVPGALLGSTLLILLPEKLRSFQDYRLLLFGIALVLVMRFRPEGIVASRRRQRELHESAEEPGERADALGIPPGEAYQVSAR